MHRKLVDKKSRALENRDKDSNLGKKDDNVATEMKGNTITFSVDICVEEDGNGFYAYCPALKGIHVDGRTQEEALENAKTAAVLYIKSMMKHGDAIPLYEASSTQETCRGPITCLPQQKHTEDIRIAI